MGESPKLFCITEKNSFPIIQKASGRMRRQSRNTKAEIEELVRGDFMQELKERGAQIFTNPYVIQVDKFAGSLKKLSDTF